MVLTVLMLITTSSWCLFLKFGSTIDLFDSFCFIIELLLDWIEWFNADDHLIIGVSFQFHLCNGSSETRERMGEIIRMEGFV